MSCQNANVTPLLWVLITMPSKAAFFTPSFCLIVFFKPLRPIAIAANSNRRGDQGLIFFLSGLRNARYRIVHKHKSIDMIVVKSITSNL